MRGRRRRCRERAPCASQCVQKRKAYEHVVIAVIVTIAVTIAATHRQRHAYEGRPGDTYLWWLWWWRRWWCRGRKRLGAKRKNIWKRQRCKRNKLADLVLVTTTSSQAGFKVASRAIPSLK